MLGTWDSKALPSRSVDGSYLVLKRWAIVLNEPEASSGRERGVFDSGSSVVSLLDDTSLCGHLLSPTRLATTFRNRERTNGSWT